MVEPGDKQNQVIRGLARELGRQTRKILRNCLELPLAHAQVCKETTQIRRQSETYYEKCANDQRNHHVEAVARNEVNRKLAASLYNTYQQESLHHFPVSKEKIKHVTCLSEPKQRVIGAYQGGQDMTLTDGSNWAS